MTATIESTDVEPLAHGQEGNGLLRKTFESHPEGRKPFQILANYIAFNATFGAGVANLAGAIGSRQDLFRDPEEEIPALADRSMDVGADIIFAAIDEFDDRSTEHRDTHRTLASATLKATAKYLGQRNRHSHAWQKRAVA